jgi:hypothetical protein
LHFVHNFLSFCSLAELVKGKPVKLIGKHFSEVEIERRRKSGVALPEKAATRLVTKGCGAELHFLLTKQPRPLTFHADGQTAFDSCFAEHRKTGCRIS